LPHPRRIPNLFIRALQDQIDYMVAWVAGVEHVYNHTVGYMGEGSFISGRRERHSVSTTTNRLAPARLFAHFFVPSQGVWNERAWTTDYVKGFRKALDAQGA
jgi:hypothetical protein